MFRVIRVVLVVLVTPSAVALAQSSATQADAAFQRGRELMAAGKTAEACAAFEDSQKVEPAVTTLLNLAGCRERLGQLATAWRLFADAERQTDTATDDTNRQLHDVARARVQKLEPRLSKLTISVSPQRRLAGLEITIDTQRVDDQRWNRPQPVDGGQHTITARAPGVEQWSTQVTIANEGGAKVAAIPDLRMLPRRQDAATPSSSSSPGPAVEQLKSSATRTHFPWVPLVVGAGAVALLGGGLGFELSGESKYDAAKAEMLNQARRTSLEDAANSRRRVAEVLTVAGLCAGGGAVWLYLRSRNHEAEPTTSTGMQIVPNGAGLAVAGRF